MVLGRPLFNKNQKKTLVATEGNPYFFTSRQKDGVNEDQETAPFAAR